MSDDDWSNASISEKLKRAGLTEFMVRSDLIPGKVCLDDRREYPEPTREAEPAHAEISETLTKLFQFVAGSSTLDSLAKKQIALIWICAPQLLDCKTATELANRFKISKQDLQNHVRLARALFANRVQNGNLWPESSRESLKRKRRIKKAESATPQP